MGKGITPIGTKLYFSESASSYTELCRIKSYGDLGGEPNTCDTTDLSDSMATAVQGTQQTDVNTFVANYNKTDYKAVKDKANTEGYYALVFSDGSAVTWQGSHTVGIVGHGVDEAPEFNIYITNSTAYEQTETFTPAGG